MNLTLSKVYNSYIILQRISGDRLPVKISYAISKNMNLLKDDAVFYEEERVKLSEEYVQRDKNNNPIPSDNGNGYKIMEGKNEEFNKKLTELSNTEVEIDPFKINLNVLLDSDITIEPIIFEVLDFIFE